MNHLVRETETGDFEVVRAREDSSEKLDFPNLKGPQTAEEKNQ